MIKQGTSCTKIVIYKKKKTQKNKKKQKKNPKKVFVQILYVTVPDWRNPLCAMYRYSIHCTHWERGDAQNECSCNQ